MLIKRMGTRHVWVTLVKCCKFQLTYSMCGLSAVTVAAGRLTIT